MDPGFFFAFLSLALSILSRFLSFFLPSVQFYSALMNFSLLLLLFRSPFSFKFTSFLFFSVGFCRAIAISLVSILALAR